VRTVEAASVTGIRELCAFTADAEELLSTVGRAASDPSLIDPFPTSQRARQRECNQSIVDCQRMLYCELPTAICYAHAQVEYDQGLRALKALKVFLAGLEREIGRAHV
jgi:hypothetical protein